MGTLKEVPVRRRLSYRPDIDGLRAVAVLSVFAFHTSRAGFAGGFVGVDIFFVISGYLISYIVYTEIAESRFSIVGFYERRIRRIFPALFAMLVPVTIFAMVYLFPYELSSYGRSLAATAFSASNFYFWKHAGYFDSSSINVLLHTWSLGVEEQFYIVFPLFLVIIRRLFPARLRTAIVVIFCFSLGLSAYVVRVHPTTAFYMLPDRAWELLAGTIVSLGMFPRLSNRILREAVTLTGAGFIAYACHFFTNHTVFPGPNAFVPVAGAALIIGAGESGPTLVGTVLSWRPVVFVGLISYSLYLWHFPVIAMRRLGVFGPMGHLTMAISLVLAISSWRFVEWPFRKGPLRLSGGPLFLASAATMAVFAAVSVYIQYTGGMQGRFPPQSEKLASFLARTDITRAPQRFLDCFVLPEGSFQDFRQDVCLHRDPAKSTTYLLIGDSHSAVIASALAQLIPNANVLQASATGCKLYLQPIGASEGCKELFRFVYQQYLPSHPLQGLLIEGRWTEEDIPGITGVINYAKSRGIPVLLFGNVQEYKEALPRLLAYSVAWNKPNLAEKYRSGYSGPLDARLQWTAHNVWHVPYVSLYQAICHHGTCQEYADQAHTIPILQDEDHFSAEGALAIMTKIKEEGQLP